MPDQLTRPDIKQFIRKHEKDDVTELMLNKEKYPDLPMKEIAEQIKSRQKAEKKLPEWYAAQDIIFPPHYRLQQASSEATAKYKVQLYGGDRFLDLTGGTGIDASYMLGQFDSGVIVERDPQMAELLKYNMAALGLNSAEIRQMSAEQFLSEDKSTFDLIYLDPSRRDENTDRVFLLEDCSPDVTALLPELLKRSDKVLIKASPMLDHTQVIQRLVNVEKVTILSVDDEVKELLIHIQREYRGDTTIVCIDLHGDRETKFEFMGTEEELASADCHMPEKYLYDPMRVLRKAGSFKLIAERFGLQKLEVNTHLYTSEHLVSDFPGRIFKVKEVLKADRKSLRKAAGSKKVNLATRNYASNISDLRKKLGITDGGRQFVFAALTQEGYRLILCEKV